MTAQTGLQFDSPNAQSRKWPSPAVPAQGTLPTKPHLLVLKQWRQA